MEEGRTIGSRVSGRPGRERAPIRPRGRARPPRRRVIASDDEGDSGADVPPSPSRPAERAGGGPRSPPARPPPPHVFDMEADISELEPATFTTLPRGQPEPMLRLAWNHKVNLIATKVLNPLIHLCEKCDCPILAYGRMIPCKHVLCYDCARVQAKCWRCGERAARVERAGLGKLFMCLHDGKRYDVSGCRRTYLSQRDLQAHINHRHRRLPVTAAGLPSVAPLRVAVPEPLPPPPPVRRPSEDRPPPDPRDPRRHEPRTPPAYGHGAGQLSAGHGQMGGTGHGAAGQGVTGHGVHSGHSGHSGHCGHGRGGHSEPGSGGGGHISPRSTAYGGVKPSAPPIKQQQIPVMTSQRSSNLITIPIQGQESAPESQSQYGGYQPAYSPAAAVSQQHSGYQQPPGPAAAFYQTTPPPGTVGYGRSFPPTGPPPTAGYGAGHAAPIGTTHGTAHGTPHVGSHPTQHTAPHGTQHGVTHTGHAATHAGHATAHAAPHATPHATHGTPHVTHHGTQHGAPQPWSAAPPTLSRPPPTSLYYR